MAKRFYIRLNVASPQTWYWSQPKQDWVVDPFAATLFDTRDEADTESRIAADAGMGEVEVCQQTFATKS